MAEKQVWKEFTLQLKSSPSQTGECEIQSNNPWGVLIDFFFFLTLITHLPAIVTHFRKASCGFYRILKINN